MTAKISKRYPYKPQTKVFKLLLKFLLNGAHKNNVLDFCNFEFTIFNDFFSTFTIVRYGEIKKPQLSGQGATIIRNTYPGALRGKCSVYMGTF